MINGHCHCVIRHVVSGQPALSITTTGMVKVTTIILGTQWSDCIVHNTGMVKVTTIILGTQWSDCIVHYNHWYGQGHNNNIRDTVVRLHCPLQPLVWSRSQQ